MDKQWNGYLFFNGLPWPNNNNNTKSKKLTRFQLPKLGMGKEGILLVCEILKLLKKCM